MYCPTLKARHVVIEQVYHQLIDLLSKLINMSHGTRELFTWNRSSFRFAFLPRFTFCRYINWVFFFFFPMLRSHDQLNFWCVTVFFFSLFFRFVFIRCFSSSRSLVRSVTFRSWKKKKKCVYRLNVFAIALVLFVPRFLFIFFFSLSFRSRSDIYFSITVYEDRLYHGLSVLARFTFCASECFSPSLSLSLSVPQWFHFIRQRYTE